VKEGKLLGRPDGKKAKEGVLSGLMMNPKTFKETKI
jgi:hypothetical protein